MWNPLNKTNLLEPQYERKFDFFASHGILFYYFSCAKLKSSSFMGEKLHCSVIHIPWHGISSKNLEKVEFVEKMKYPIGRSTISGKCLAEAVRWEVEE